MFSKHVAKTVGVGSSLPLTTPTHRPPPTHPPPPFKPRSSHGFWVNQERAKGDGEQKARTEAPCTFVLSMNCEWANKFFQPLSPAFTDIPHRLHTQITAQWRPPGGPGRHRAPRPCGQAHITRLPIRLGKGGGLQKSCSSTQSQMLYNGW